MPYEVTSITPPSNAPLPPVLQCVVGGDKGPGDSTVTFYLVNETNNDSQDEVLDGVYVPTTNPAVYSATVNPRRLTAGDIYTVLVIATEGANTASGCSTNCPDNL
jgi:hypothetical protein